MLVKVSLSLISFWWFGFEFWLVFFGFACFWLVFWMFAFWFVLVVFWLGLVCFGCLCCLASATLIAWAKPKVPVLQKTLKKQCFFNDLWLGIGAI